MTTDRAKAFQYLRQVDFARVTALKADERYNQRLLDDTSGATTCMLSFVQTPPNGGSPEGMHVHAVDQQYYVLSGVVALDIDGQRLDAQPGSLVVIPAGVPHRNWNAGSEPTQHLAINTPAPTPGQPLSRPFKG